MKRILLYLIAVFMSCSVLALDLQQAKSQGLVGEANTGLIAPVTASPSQAVRSLVANVNQQRNARFKQIAVSHGLSVREVGHLAYKKAVERTAPGHYYQAPSGKWVKK